MKITIFDIETYRDYFCFAYATYNEWEELIERGVYDGKDTVTADAMQCIDNILGLDAPDYYIVSFNGNKFDLPILAKMKTEFKRLDTLPTKYIYEDAQALISYDRFNNPIIKKHHRCAAWDVHHFDLLNCCLLNKSLKQWEMYNGLPIRELPYPPDAKLTDDMCKEIREYCEHDVTSTAKIFFKLGYDKSFAGKPTLLAYRELWKMLPAHMKTNFAKTPAAVATAIVYETNMPIPPRTINPFELFQLETFDVDIDLKLMLARIMKSYNEKLVDTTWNGITYGKGGAHYARPGRHDDVYEFDVAGQYPSIIRQYKLLKTTLALENYGKVADDRLRIKHDPSKSALNQAEKLILNSLSGAFRIKSTHGVAYDPAAGEAMCAIAQLIITMCALASPREMLLEVNTDSVFVSGPEAAAAVRRRCDELSKKYRLIFEEEHTPIIYFRDVNNYIKYNSDGSVKQGKGDAYSDYLKKNSNRAVYSELFRHLIIDKLDLHWDLYEWRDFIYKYHRSAASKYATIDGEPMKFRNYYMMWTKPECPGAVPISFSRDLINRQNGSIKARFGIWSQDINHFEQYKQYIDYTQYHRDLDDEFELWNRLDLCTTRLPKAQRKRIKTMEDALPEVY